MQLFFVLSGFLITSLLLREHDATGTVRLREFYIRRARRLRPALVTICGWYLVFSLFCRGGPGEPIRAVGTVSRALFYVENLHPMVDAVPSDGYLSHTWSLAAMAALAVHTPTGLNDHMYVITSVTSVTGGIVVMTATQMRWLHWRPLIYFGTISYGLNLWHVLALRFALNPLLTVLASIAVADLSFRYIESPFMRARAIGDDSCADVHDQEMNVDHKGGSATSPAVRGRSLRG